MVPETSRAVRRMTFVLLALAACAVEIAAVDTRPVGQSLGLAGAWVAGAAVLAWLVRPPSDPRRNPPGWVYALVLALAAVPFAAEPLWRAWTGNGYPLELRVVAGLRNVGLGLAACAGWFLCLRTACVASLFLVLFSAAMSNHPAVLVILGLYTAAGSAWLMLAYWTGLRGVLAAPTHEAEVEVRTGHERLPWVSLFVVLGLVGVVLGLIAVGPARAARTLGEWVPTSGGTGEYDRFSRGGVNDGDEETSGANAQSTGMTKTDTFLNSPLPSLYDVTSDLYGPPCKSHEHERAIALETETARDAGKRPPDSLRPNREFPAARQGGRKPKPPKDRLARALFEVEGRPPLHVRVVAYDTFDGRVWREAPMVSARATIEKAPDSNWMSLLERPAPPVFARPDAHTFKLSAPEGALLPTPPHLTRFRVGRVDRAEFFGWGHDRVLRFAERKTPSGISIETECRTVDPRKLAGIEFPTGAQGERTDYSALPPTIDPRVVALVQAWARERPRGWSQIAAVIEHLRTEYAHDHTYPTPDGCTDPVAHFLFESRRGPDHQFASAAAVLLRALSYPTRLVSGFYVHPDHYDPETKHTPVGKDDLHFWPEVLLPNGDWLVLEPTPGYEVPGPNVALSEQIIGAAIALAHWAAEHGIALGLGLVTLAFGGYRRRELFDAVAVRRWRWFPARTWPEQVRRALALLERRGRWAGRPRATGQTVLAWLRTAGPDPDLARLARAAEWASYAPAADPPWPADDALAACRDALTAWPLGRWRAEQPKGTAMFVRVGVPLLGCAILLGAGAGCGGADAPPGPEADHAHRAGGHGGSVVAIGRGHYHVEAVFSDGGAVELFVLGPDETRVQEVPTQTLAAYVKAADRMQADPITFEPRPQPDDPAGTTSRFAGTLPAHCAGREVLISVPRLAIGGERFRFSVTRTAPPVAMPAKVLDTEERRLYLTPGGKYTAADIAANGNRTASEAFKGMISAHDHDPKPGDRLCPVTRTKANPACAWTVGGQKYEFCCPPCVDEFVALAKEKPEQIKPPGEYVKK